jgi:circadian clock protein KaiC
MRSIGIDIEKIHKTGNIHFYHARPTIQNLELHFMAVKELIEKISPEIIILDPITNLMTEGPNSDIREMLTRFIDFLKTKQITVMLTAAITLGTISRVPSDEGISSMVDTWIMIEDIDLNAERKKIIYVMKSRGMNHSKDIKSFTISSDGILLNPILKKELEVRVSPSSSKKKNVLADQSNSSGNHK